MMDLKSDKVFIMKGSTKEVDLLMRVQSSQLLRRISDIYLLINESLSLSNPLEAIGLGGPRKGPSNRLEWSLLSNAPLSDSTRSVRGPIECMNWAVVSKFLTIDPSERRSSVSISTEPLSQLTGLRVIDTIQWCLTRLPSGATYITLSYVWGESEGSEVHLCRSNLALLEQLITDASLPLPRTITDAKGVRQKLDQRFL
jgi:hypothetical protein